MISERKQCVQNRRTVFAAVISFAVVTGAQAAVIVGEAEVVDGDTLYLGIVPIRIHGIDAPENGQRCALPEGGRWSCDDAARDRLTDLVEGHEVRCEVQDVDPYGRLVSVCMAGGTNVGEALIAEGLAWAFIEYLTITPFRKKWRARQVLDFGKMG
jgi:endonuclease YncB( thermonuclease family)